MGRQCPEAARRPLTTVIGISDFGKESRLRTARTVNACPALEAGPLPIACWAVLDFAQTSERVEDHDFA